MVDEKQKKLKVSGEAAREKSSSRSPGGGLQQCPGGGGWIEIELLDEEDKGIPNQLYRIVLADGTRRTGKTDAYGVARVECIQEGMCKVSFPDLDADTWEKVGDDRAAGKSDAGKHSGISV